MKQTKKHNLLMLVATCMMIVPAISSATLSADDPYKQKKGLFWYEIPLKKEDKKQEKEKHPRPIIPSSEELFNMHPKDLEALLDQTREYAVYTLTPEATLDYYKVQDAARRKAAAFTNLTGYVMLEHPELNAAQDYPITNPGTAQKQRERQKGINDGLVKNRDDYALLFFMEPDCGYCVQQSHILENLQRDTGWYIKQIDITTNPQARKKFNIDRTPVTVLIKKDRENQWMPVSVGADSLDNLKTSIYNMTRVLNGETDPRQFFTNGQQKGGFFDPLKRVDTNILNTDQGDSRP